MSSAPVVMIWAVNAFASAKLACPNISATCKDCLIRASSSKHLRVSLHNLSLHSVAAPLSTSRVPTAAKGCVLKVGTFPLPLHFRGSSCFFNLKRKEIFSCLVPGSIGVFKIPILNVSMEHCFFCRGDSEMSEFFAYGLR
jgi:hypothetical protein